MVSTVYNCRGVQNWLRINIHCFVQRGTQVSKSIQKNYWSGGPIAPSPPLETMSATHLICRWLTFQNIILVSIQRGLILILRGTRYWWAWRQYLCKPYFKRIFLIFFSFLVDIVLVYAYERIYFWVKKFPTFTYIKKRMMT